jgi:hypothetical protein
MVAPALLGLLLLAVLGPWNIPQPKIQDNSGAQVLVNDDANVADQPSEPSGTLPESTATDETSMVETAADQPVIEGDSTPVITDSPPVAPITSVTSNNNSPNNAVTDNNSESTSTLITSSGGHSHRSHSSSADDNNVSTGNEGSGGTNGGNDQGSQTDDLPDEDSFFVLPESPIGGIAMVLAATGMLGAFMFLRARKPLPAV